MTINEFLSQFQNVAATPKGYVACCPAHDDTRPSLSIREAEDRRLVHCWAGCQTSDVLAAVGLDFRDLFLDNAETNGRPYRNGPRQSERLPHWYWDWRSQCGELELLIQEKREHAEGIIAATKGLDVNALSASEFDEVMDLVACAYDWLARCDRLDETVFLLQQTLRQEERVRSEERRKAKVAA